MKYFSQEEMQVSAVADATNLWFMCALAALTGRAKRSHPYADVLTGLCGIALILRSRKPESHSRQAISGNDVAYRCGNGLQV